MTSTEIYNLEVERLDYQRFITNKSQISNDGGFEPLWMPDCLFGFQRYIVDWELRRGRGAMFCDCGLGKSLMELVWAKNVVMHTNRPVLILTPLAVGIQMIAEGQKFGIDCRRCPDGKLKHGDGIVIANYERIHYFDPNSFAGVVCDECFPPDTLVDTPLGQCYIKNIRAGDFIINASGKDEVENVHRRPVERAIRIRIGANEDDSITSSPNHPYLTRRGWVGAQDLQPGDFIMETTSAMRVVRSRSDTNDVPRRSEEILREILLSEMADEQIRIQGTSIYSGTAREGYGGHPEMVAAGHRQSESCQTQDRCAKSNGQSRNSRQSLPDIEEHEPQTFRTWWKRPCSNGGPDLPIDSTGTGLDFRISLITGAKDSWLSNMLQAGLSQSRTQNRHRGGWALSLLKEGSGQEKGCEAGFVRVESLEVLEPGHPDLERYRDADGRIYFYDLGATQHPSFSVKGLVVHNSSILKNFNGKRKSQITEFMRTVPFRLLGTATAAPNNYTELGTSSEALGEMGHMDMLARFFKNDQNTCDTKTLVRKRIAEGGPISAGWRFKGHAEQHFYRWICSWARAGRKPSDFGDFDDSLFKLPPLTLREHVVETTTLAEGMLFAMPATNMREERDERRRTIQERCEKAAELVHGTGQPAVIWCHLNSEGDLIEQIVPECKQIKGATSEEAREEIYAAFANGQLRVLPIKSKIGAWGLNWQHCNHVVTFATHSYEQYYQGVRRCWRFGQKRPVTVDLIATEGEIGAKQNMLRKSDAADRMFTELTAHMNESERLRRGEVYEMPVSVPDWMQ